MCPVSRDRKRSGSVPPQPAAAKQPVTGNLDPAVRKIRIGTRGSLLALRQTEIISAELRRLDPEVLIEVETIVTTGDRKQSGNGTAVRDKREWIQELEQALLERRIDLAIHSGKDVPVETAARTTLFPVLTRETPEDLLILPRNGGFAADGMSFDRLPAGLIIGTSSLRRTAQLRRARPDIKSVELRGNVPTRLERLIAGRADGLIIARAGIERLSKNPELKGGSSGQSIGELLAAVSISVLPPAIFLPAVNQGILAAQIRADDNELKARMERLSVEEVLSAFRAERAFVSTLGADCRSAVGVLASVNKEILSVHGAVYSKDGSEVIEGVERGHPELAPACGEKLAQRLLEKGAGRLLV